ncbi:MerR family transcriptional regulator [Halobacillus yeomjeoni]|uniref:MerR family transcriptional regulator n=1 Tax=Halobacillus yeomjeoni TaxID=311194 RepID=UPI001CD583EF|nr:MerR family transcriptional regulator [Halobacillus yeomjeoni]MCA0982993.1 MerR family transcriptional regulator [Halobacillus yeomjeoni]
MASTKPKYNIKAVSQMVGIQPGTLRAWERRYRMIRPTRNEAGHRLYTDEHIKILKWLMEKVDKGFTISQAVSLLESSDPFTSGGNNVVDTNQLDSISNDLIEALLSFNEQEAQRIMDHSFSLFTPETVAIDIIGPMLMKVGDLWEVNKITSAHEHFASHFLRSRMGMMLLSIPVEPILPKALLVCGPEERHELGLLIFALYLKRKGYDVIYLGQSIIPKDMDTVIREVDPTYLFMSCTLKRNVPASLKMAESLQDSFPDLKIGLGGYAYHSLSPSEKERVRPFEVGNNKSEWDAWLAEEK